MKKTSLIFVILLMVSCAAIAQQMQFQACTDCSNSLSNTYAGNDTGTDYADTLITMASSNVVSDFGRRESNSRWHMGVDVSIQQNTGSNADVGDHIMSIEEGRISMIRGGNYSYKVIAVAGEHRFGYGHMFFDGTGTTKKSGDMILQRLDFPYDVQNRYAIIYAPADGNVIAYSEIDSATVTHPDINGGNPIYTTDSIAGGEPIAPLGNSGGNFSAHLHLYNFNEDPVYDDVISSATTGYPITYFRNPKDPLQFVDHEQADYDVTIDSIQLVYPGHNSSTIRVKCQMANSSGTYTGLRYDNAVMNIDESGVYIKKTFDEVDNYQLIKGPHFDLKISDGSKMTYDTIQATNRYPSPGFPSSNTTYDIALTANAGDFGTTGIRGIAYNGSGNNNNYDHYYFADFATRIHKDDDYGGGGAAYAAIGEDARYPDGRYHLRAKATTVRNEVHYSTDFTPPELPIDPDSLLIDNFRPYVKRALILNSIVPIYDALWQWNEDSAKLDLLLNTVSDTPFDQPLTVTATTSEPMQNLSMSMNGQAPPYVSDGTDITRTIWTFNIPVSDIENLLGTQALHFTGADLAGNPLLGFTDQAPGPNAHAADELPHRTGADSNRHILAEQPNFFEKNSPKYL